MEVERPASAGPNHSRPTSRTASERSVSERVSNRPSTAGSRVSLDELTGLDTELKKSQEEVNRLKLECIRWESAAAESAAAEEDAKYQTQLKELEVQVRSGLDCFCILENHAGVMWQV